MDQLLQLKQTIEVFLFAFALASYTLSPAVLAVTPAPDGGYPGGNTAEGKALFLFSPPAATTRQLAFYR